MYKFIYFLGLILIYFFIGIKCTEPYKKISYTFPHYHNMNNGNNLLCSTKGIYIFDLNFEKILSYYDFEEEIYTLEDSRFITIKQFSDEDGGNILLLTKEIFYFLNPDGTFIFKNKINIENTGLIYSLVPYKKNNNYNFIMGFINKNSRLNLCFYSINASQNKIDLIYDYEVNSDNTNDSNFDIDNAFDCKIMNSNLYGDVLTCFYFYKNIKGICTTSFNIENNFSIYSDLNLCSINNTAINMQVEIYKIKSKSIICFLESIQANGHCMIFDINSISFSNSALCFYLCKKEPEKIKLKYIKQTQEYIFSCFADGIFQFNKIQININNNSENIIFTTMSSPWHPRRCRRWPTSLTWLSNCRSNIAFRPSSVR